MSIISFHKVLGLPEHAQIDQTKNAKHWYVAEANNFFDGSFSYLAIVRRMFKIV